MTLAESEGSPRRALVSLPSASARNSPGPPSMTRDQDPPTSFEAALTELEEIVATMEGGKLPLKESLAAYKRGALLLQYCQSTLKDAQQQVQVLEKGVLKPFDAADAGASDES